MYVRRNQRPRSAADVAEVIARNMFATLVSHSAAGMIASHLPFLFDPAAGEHGTLYAHMARANPHGSILGQGEESMVIFTGPHAYLSPSWYADRETAPTWDYVAVHCYGAAVLHDPAGAKRNLARLVEAMESTRPDRWSFADLTEEDVQQLIANVVSFEIPLSRIEAGFKLSQGDQPERIHAAIAHLEGEGEAELAEYIRRYNG